MTEWPYILLKSGRWTRAAIVASGGEDSLAEALFAQLSDAMKAIEALPSRVELESRDINPDGLQREIQILQNPQARADMIRRVLEKIGAIQ